MSYTNAARFLAPRIIASLQLPRIYIQTIYKKVSQVYAVCTPPHPTPPHPPPHPPPPSRLSTFGDPPPPLSTKNG
jgi:hypothetical protein